MSIKGILFDKDGTLIDINGTWVPVYKYLLEKDFGLSPEDAETMMERAGYDPARQAFKAGSMLASGSTAQLVDFWWPSLSPAKRIERIRSIDHDYREIAGQSLQVLLPLEPVLDELSALGFALGVATNDSRASAESHIKQLGIAHKFETIIGWDSVPSPKPSGDMIRAFAEVTALRPIEIAMVGDNAHDIEEGRRGGAGLCIAVLTGNSAHEDLAHLADHTLESVAELPSLMRRL
ncbi:MAG: HAD family hydrolase [Aestuariivirga sp.]